MTMAVRVNEPAQNQETNGFCRHRNDLHRPSDRGSATVVTSPALNTKLLSSESIKRPVPNEGGTNVTSHIVITPSSPEDEGHSRQVLLTAGPLSGTESFEMSSAQITESKSKSHISFYEFCECTSLHGWKYLSRQMNQSLWFGWVAVVLASVGVAGYFLGYSARDFLSATVQTTTDTTSASLKEVFFPAITICNINQMRRSLFEELGISKNSTILSAILGQLYTGLDEELPPEQMDVLRGIFASETILRKGILTDVMYTNHPLKADAIKAKNMSHWKLLTDMEYVRDAGFFFKTMAAQEVMQNLVLRASYRRQEKDVDIFSDMLPFFGTDYGLCTLIKPQLTFNKSLEHLAFDPKMRQYTRTIAPGVQLGKENGLSLLLDAETYDYAYSKQGGEGFKLAVHHHMAQPIMSMTDIDITPGFEVQVTITPTLITTTPEARERFSPEERGCLFDDELKFKYLPEHLYHYDLSNCLFSATYEDILAQCKCVPYFHSLAYLDYPHICHGTSLKCMNNILLNIGTHNEVTNIHTGQKQRCLSACEVQSNALAVTMSTFPNRGTFLHRKEFCILFKKIGASCQTWKKETLERRYPNVCQLMKENPTLCGQTADAVPQSDLWDSALPLVYRKIVNNTNINGTNIQNLITLLYDYARENVVLVNAYVKDPAVTKIKRDQKIPVIWFIANIGGILGLCMGCSLVTIFEVLHHILTFLVFKVRRAYKRRIENKERERYRTNPEQQIYG